MADSRFHSNSGPISLGELADITGAVLSDNADSDLMVTDVAPLDRADSDTLSFLDNVRYKDQFAASRAGVCIAAPEMQDVAPDGMVLLLTKFPYKAYAIAAQAFYPEAMPEPAIAETAVIDPQARIADGCVVEPGAVIMRDAEIGEGCFIEANAVIGASVILGRSCRVGANATISHSIIGDHVRIYPGCRIGQDGFGFAIDPAGHVKVPQLGRVLIGDSVEIGANTTIDRGAGPDTEIGQGTWIDNLVQIGHNACIGKGCVIVSQVGISGSAVLDDFVVVGGQAGIAGHLHIGKGVRIGAQSGVMRDVEPGQDVIGAPAIPGKQFMRQVALLNRLVKKKD